ncbi:MAG: S9 family peptidase [Candidatus Nealsonbacteria bacterium]|nr:S9 family peptidase [Candidatus Nealsonbacteria bacterium]
MKIKIPITEKLEIVEDINGLRVADPYRWLEDEKSRKVKSWVKSQNAFTKSVLGNVGHQKDLTEKRLKELFSVGGSTTPIIRGNRYFFFERKGSDDLHILYLQEGLQGKPRVLLDPNKMSKDKSVDVGEVVPSRDGKLLAYAVNKNGASMNDLRILDVETGMDLPGFIPGKLNPCSIVWSVDSKAFWYSRRLQKAPKGEKQYHLKVFFHRLGDDWREDKLVFGENLSKYHYPGAEISLDGRYLLIGVMVTRYHTELFLKDLQNPASNLIPVVQGVKSVFNGAIHRDSIYILTNHNAPLWKLMKVKISDADKGFAAWQTVIPDSRHKIERSMFIKDKIIVEKTENVCSVLTIHDLDGKLLSKISLPPLSSVVEISGEEEGDEFFFSFESFLLPPAIFHFDLGKGSYKPFKNREVPGFDSSAFKAEQIWYTSKDGTLIPMFLVHKKSLEFNSNNPTILYGYGGFNVNKNPEFNKGLIPFLENGGIYAVANIRGGGEFGEEWHKAGMLEKKQNVFDDFIAAAEWLIKNGYTNPKRLAIMGGSNGGLLVCAVLAQRPDLMKAVVAEVPLSDMVRYHKFHHGMVWTSEYGNPDKAEDLRYIFAYSPYHNVKDGENYPATMIMVGTEDDNVHPFHGYKMIARLQEANRSSDPIILRAEDKAGHGGANAVSKLIEEEADKWGFLFWQLGVKR